MGAASRHLGLVFAGPEADGSTRKHQATTWAGRRSRPVVTVTGPGARSTMTTHVFRAALSTYRLACADYVAWAGFRVSVPQ